jgi:hypothetical protein
MSNYKKIAEDLTRSLQLSQRPIAIAFAYVPPVGVHAFNGVVPAGCSFWQLAAASMFYTSAKDHELCSIGIHTHHLAQPSPRIPIRAAGCPTSDERPGLCPSGRGRGHPGGAA